MRARGIREKAGAADAAHRNHAASAVDVLDAQADHLRGPEPRRVRGGQRGTALETGHRLEEGNDLIGAQHDRKLTRLPRVGIRSGIIASPSVTP